MTVLAAVLLSGFLAAWTTAWYAAGYRAGEARGKHIGKLASYASIEGRLAAIVATVHEEVSQTARKTIQRYVPADDVDEAVGSLAAALGRR